MTSAVLAGSTGRVGSHILTTLLALPSISAVFAYTRRDLAHLTSHKLTPLQSLSPTDWPSLFPTSPPPQLFLSGLGTSKAAAGSFENQYKIDHDLNLALATAAKHAGADTYVLISAVGASATSRFAYNRMKGELEEAVKALGFEHTVIVRPGLIVGQRESAGAAEVVLRSVANGLGKVWNGLKDPWAQDSVVIARAAVAAGLACVEGKREAGVWVVGMGEIVRLGRVEWRE
ncbi:NAD dependent epimerase/dehydratase family protein-like protein [Mytilinidion resinicola]|uniref:NAD dependent epimerase/dehydratase family protein-like protein n=1 Tax=Mytilinidion resinicola TaxID=574789 RepID=A0A6A6Y0Z5_9PEZI|nr:NAD dependent epimerase/dehydratase family protein-like protein [Mytilinidion resinicola]KAF2802228.1 NAD dependent epimerase/dehydratase family protein-like protein [Mytilinidion resinicola]